MITWMSRAAGRGSRSVGRGLLVVMSVFVVGLSQLEAAPLEQKGDASWISIWRARNAAPVLASASLAPHERASWSWPKPAAHQTAQALVVQTTSGDSQSITTQLAGGQHVWPLSVKISAGIRLVAVNGLLPDTPLVEYLRYRRSLNPARFDRWHPNVGRLLAVDEATRETAGTPTEGVTQVVTPPPPPPTTSTAGGPDPTVPEPSTAMIGMVLVASVTLTRRLARRQAS
jgi:hypothetical protein